MDIFDKGFWAMIATLVGLITLQGGILLAAFKSIFTTKKELNETVNQMMSRLYDDVGMTVFIPRKECNTFNKERERRIDLSQRTICTKIEKLADVIDVVKENQHNSNESISNLVGRFDQSIKQTSALLYGELLNKAPKNGV